MVERRVPISSIRRRIEIEENIQNDDNKKTAAMFRLERKWERSIRELLVDGGAEQVAIKLGISENTVYTWKVRLGLLVAR